VAQILPAQDSSSSHQEIIRLRTTADIHRDMHHLALGSINLIHTNRVLVVVVAAVAVARRINILPE